MANEGDERRISMDLNLYLGLPLSPRPRVPDLGSDLALGSVSSTAAADETREPAVDMPVLEDPSDAQTPYSPPHASFPPETMVVGQEQYFQSGNFSLEFQPSSSLPFQPVMVIPYAPSYVSSAQAAVDIADEHPIGDEAAHVPYNPASHGIASEPMVGAGDSRLPFSSSYLTSVASTQVHSDLPVVPYQPTMQSSDVYAHGGSSSRQNISEGPEFRFQSLIESNRRVRARRFRSSLPYADEYPGFDAASFPALDQNLPDVNTIPEGPVETSGKSKANEDGVGKDDLEEEKEEKSSGAISFDCNICFDVAKEPVVTSCGHLFCWPCLYQWLHQYSDHKECPICKGQVTDSNITPIYGRGSKEAVVEVKTSPDGDPELKIPPRPRGRRFESLRQRIQRPFPRGDGIGDHFRRLLVEEPRNGGRFEGFLDPLSIISGRLEEGVSNLQRHQLDEGLQSGNRTERYLDPTMQHIIDQRRVMTRLRARRLVRRTGDNRPTQVVDQRDLESGLNPVGGASGVSLPSQQAANQSAALQDGNNSLNRYTYDISTSERLAAIHSELSRLVSRFARNSNHSVASAMTSNPQNIAAPHLSNPQNPDNLIVQLPVVATQSTEQVSASSTMAVIQDDAGATDTSAEPNRAGSSRSSRRRGRSNASGSLDVDGGNQTNKRRRLN